MLWSTYIRSLYVYPLSRETANQLRTSFLAG